MRKILCSGSLATEPSNQISELDSSNSVVSGKDQNLNAEQSAEVVTAATTTTPGIVARLMGLESMGDIPCGSKPSSLSRSRSMNSMDYLGECNRMHKRVNSTLSFREAPNFLLTENENFLVFSFEGGGESSRALKSNNVRKRKMGCAELKQKVATERGNELKENKKENVFDEKILIEKGKMSKKGSHSDKSCGNAGNRCKPQEITNTSHRFKAPSEKKCFDSEAVKLSQPVNNKEAVIGEKQKRRRRRKKTDCYKENKTETECKSEDSSPVSVLDFERQSSAAGLFFFVNLSSTFSFLCWLQ